jgi:4-carboxymuconolactone decarboxylase
MSDEPNQPSRAVRQGSGEPWRERLPLMPREAMNAAQRETADALVAGPRQGVYGPFVPLLRSPSLLDRVAKVGEYLRFESVLGAQVREFTMCIVARHAGNQFEWAMHAPLAIAAGVSATAVESLRQGARPKELTAELEAVLDFAAELLHTHGVSEPAYQAVLARLGEQGLVELATLIGYFLMVSWVMNVAHTPAPDSGKAAPLPPFPA